MISTSHFKKNIEKFFERVSNSSEILTISINNEDDAVVMMSIKEYNALNETVYLFSTTANRKRLQQSIAQISL